MNLGVLKNSTAYTNSKLLANSIYLWYNNTNSPKTKYRKQLSKMETHFAGFLFSKILEKRTLWLKSLLKQYPSFTTLLSF